MSSTTSQPSETTTVRAVTTIFTPPSSCIERTYTISRLGEDFTDTRSNTLTIYRAYSSECFPSEASPSAGYVFLSPGICPSAYSIASMWTDKNIGYTATFATCCPWLVYSVSQSGTRRRSAETARNFVGTCTRPMRTMTAAPRRR